MPNCADLPQESTDPEVPALEDVFVFYRDYVKPLYTEIEARDNTLPIELLFEIHAAFDHLRRAVVDDGDQAKEVRKAIGHLKRGSLDAFKLKLKYFHNDVRKLLSEDTDYEIIDQGNFLPGLYCDRQQIMVSAKGARLSESNREPDEAFKGWTATSLAIDDFYDKYLNREDSIAWAKRETKKRLNRRRFADIWVGLCIGTLASIIGALLLKLI